MGILYGLEVLYADELPDFARVDNLFQGNEVRGIAQHVAYPHDGLLFQGQVAYVGALFFGGGNRFFEQDVVAHFESLHARLVVQVVGQAEHDGIGHLGAGEGLFPIGEPVLLRHVVVFAHVLQPQPVDVGHAHDFHAVGVAFGIAGVDVSAVAGTEYEKGHRSVDRGFQIFYLGIDMLYVVRFPVGQNRRRKGRTNGSKSHKF